MEKILLYSKYYKLLIMMDGGRTSPMNPWRSAALINIVFAVMEALG